MKWGGEVWWEERLGLSLQSRLAVAGTNHKLLNQVPLQQHPFNEGSDFVPLSDFSGCEALFKTRLSGQMTCQGSLPVYCHRGEITNWTHQQPVLRSGLCHLLMKDDFPKVVHILLNSKNVNYPIFSSYGLAHGKTWQIFIFSFLNLISNLFTVTASLGYRAGIRVWMLFMVSVLCR